VVAFVERVESDSLEMKKSEQDKKIALPLADSYDPYAAAVLRQRLGRLSK
jgi:hypothetical protein